MEKTCAKCLKTYHSCFSRNKKYCSLICKNGTMKERFWAKVNKADACWLWTGAKRGSNTYGVFYDGELRKRVGAHHFSYTLHKGEITEGLLVLHTCDTPLCVNPDHLFLGTSRDNTQDMLKKGRCNPPEGERQGRSKLTAGKVKQIRVMIGKFKTKLIAEKFGVHTATVYDIKQGKTWKHI